MKRSKSEVITFKVDESLQEAMGRIPNRSEFIRSALLAALDGACPLCGGTGTLTPNQKRHLKELRADHAFRKCSDCNEIRLVCERSTRHGQTSGDKRRSRQPSARRT
jgi:hypothetical protein